jgi:choline dehydrogenase-like flavoprotein
VLLLEAGRGFTDDDPRPLELRRPRGVTDPAYLWRYEGVATSHAGHTLEVVRGKALGGSGAVNGVSCVRGIPADYDAWGSDEWSWPAALQAFRQLETDTDFRDAHHGDSGPIPIRRHPIGEWSALDVAFFETARNWGFPEQADVNSPERNGIGPMPRNLREGERVDTAVAYLQPARGRANLTVATGSVVRRVVIDGTRARVVEFERSGTNAVAQAGAVVLAAGAIASPQLLFVSGVGAADDLRACGLPVVADLPGVGKGIQDHPTVTLPLRPTEAATPEIEAPPAPLVVNYTADGSAYVSDLQLMLISGSPTYAGASVGLVSFLTRGVSRGELRFVPFGSSIRPRVHYHYLEDASDRQRLRQGLRISAELARSEPLVSFLAAVDGPSGDELRSDAALDGWIGRHVATAFHTVASCRLGARDDPGAVVNERCRVHGIENLYVADLSIAPAIVRANTFATAVMIGERAAQLIDGDLRG